MMYERLNYVRLGQLAVVCFERSLDFLGCYLDVRMKCCVCDLSDGTTVSRTERVTTGTVTKHLSRYILRKNNELIITDCELNKGHLYVYALFAQRQLKRDTSNLNNLYLVLFPSPDNDCHFR